MCGKRNEKKRGAILNAVAEVALICVISLLSFGGCTVENLRSYTNSDYFGTVLNVVSYTSNARFKKFCGVVDDVLYSVDSLLGFDFENSDINRINSASKGESVRVDKETYDILTLAKKYCLETEGAFNPCAYYLTDLWGFSERVAATGGEMPYDREKRADGGYNLPEEKYIEAFMQLSDFDCFSLSERSEGCFVVRDGGEVEVDGVIYTAKIDFGGLIKGYAVDKIIDLAKRFEIEKGYIGFGGSSMYLFKNSEGKDWTLSLTNPRKTGNEDYVFASKAASEISVSTSGDYENYYITDSVRYCHIMDCSTGYPVSGEVISATVYGENAMLCDIMSTAVMVLKKDKTLGLIKDGYFGNKGLDVTFTEQGESNINVFSTVELDIKIEGFNLEIIDG